MRYLKYVLSLVIVGALVACGGGNLPDTTTGSGTSGTTGSGTTGTGTTTTAAAPTLTLALVDSAGAVVTSNSINSSAAVFAQATVKDATGAAVASKLVTFSTDPTVAVLAQTTALTNAAGVTKVQISPVSLTSSGDGSLAAAANVKGTAIQNSLDFQTAASNVTLTNLTVAPNSISALQSSAVTVQGRVNGVLATSSAVQVNFSASCGSFSPATASTSGSGIASTTYQSAATCSGTVTLTAQATGAAAVTAPITVAAAAPANVIYTSAGSPLLVVSTAPTGNKQSIVRFQVLDSNGAGMSGQQVSVALQSTAISAGVTFSVGGSATQTPQTVTTDASGYATVTVSSGALPTPLVVTATLVGSIPVITASSSGIAVTGGVAAQNSASLSASKLSIEGYSHDGVPTTLTMRVADRSGNPVPVGSVVNFVTNYGIVNPGSCTLDSTSSCTVTYSSQGTIRGYSNLGRVAILAYMQGEESFTDQNGNNTWDSGEPVFVMGQAYLDDNEDQIYESATEQLFPDGRTDSGSCLSNPYSNPSQANTCHDPSTGPVPIRVRKQIVIVLSTDQAAITQSGSRTLNGFSIQVADLHGNPMATGSTVAAAVTTSGSACTVNSVSPSTVVNTNFPTIHTITLNGDASCASATVLVTVTSTGGLPTVHSF